MPLSLPYPSSGSAGSLMNLWASPAPGLRARAVEQLPFCKALCGLDKGDKQTETPTAMWSMTTHLLWCYLCKMGWWAKGGWQSRSYHEDTEWKLFNTLLGLKLSQRRFREDKHLTLRWKNRDAGDGQEERWANIKERVVPAEERRESKSLKRGSSVLGRKKSIHRNEWIR